MRAPLLISRIGAALALAFSLAIFAQPAAAQKTKATVQSEIQTDIPDNVIGAITPQSVRTILGDMVNSWQQFAGVNTQVGTTYAVQQSDYGQLITFCNTSAIAVSLPQPIGGFSTFNTTFANKCAGAVTITPTSSTIGGNATLVLQDGSATAVVSDGANYQLSTSPPGTYPVTGTNGDLLCLVTGVVGDCNTGASANLTVPLEITIPAGQLGALQTNQTLTGSASSEFDANKLFCADQLANGPTQSTWCYKFETDFNSTLMSGGGGVAVIYGNKTTASANSGGGFYVALGTNMQGSAGDGGVNTTTSNSVSGGATSLPLASTVGFLAGDSIRVTLASGLQFDTAQVGAPSGGAITISPGLPGGSTGNVANGGAIWNPKGNLDGALLQSTMLAGATNLNGITGGTATAYSSGGSTFRKTSFSIEKDVPDTVVGSVFDNMLDLTAQVGVTALAGNGIVIDEESGLFPLATTAYAFKVGGAFYIYSTIKGGIDLTQVVMTEDALKWGQNATPYSLTAAGIGNLAGLNLSGFGSPTAPALSVGDATTGLFSNSTTGFGFAVNGANEGDWGYTNAGLWTLAGGVTTNGSLISTGGISEVINSFGEFMALQSSGGPGFRWNLNNNTTWALQSTNNGFASGTVVIETIAQAGAVAYSNTVQSAGLIETAAAPTVAAAQVGFGSTTAATGNCGTLAGDAGCLVINVAGTTRYVPYY